MRPLFTTSLPVDTCMSCSEWTTIKWLQDF